ncbi:MAG: type II toxin-antitoxin system HicA family toxin [Burkholderiaceae bacterium]|jgi:hypothetical protein|nr:type II toxin-antitoxin system HicA family toxin [Burkholderiaceae bacterium]
MGSGFYQPLRAILPACGCTMLRQGRGSHEIWFSPVSGQQFPLAVTVLSRHMANAILKQAGIDKRF